MRPQCVAADTPTELNDAPVRFGVVEAGPTEPTASGELGDTTDGYSFRLVPLVNAYVIFAPPTPGEGFEDLPELLRPPAVVVARTNAAGHVLVRFRSSVHDDPASVSVQETDDPVVTWAAQTPPEPPLVLRLGQLTPTMGCFWTYDRDVYEVVVAALDEDHAAAHARFRFEPLSASLRPHAAPLDLPLLSDDENEKIAHLLLTSAERGFFRARGARDGHVEYCASGVLFDVTPRALRAFYAVEWAGRYAMHVRKSTIGDWNVLVRMCNIIRAYETGEAVPELDRGILESLITPPQAAALFRGFGARPGRTVPLPHSYELQLAERLRSYAHRCVEVGVSGAVFRRAVSIAPDDPSWREAADDIRGQRGVLHPWHELGDRAFLGIRLAERARRALADYFDMYEFAKGRRQEGLHDAVRRHHEAVLAAQGWVDTRCRRILREHAPHDAFAFAVGFQISMDAEVQLAVHERYLAACAHFRHPFWTEVTTDGQWDGLVDAVKWMGKLSGKTASAFKTFFEQHVKDYAWNVGRAAEANAALNFFYRYHLAVEGRPFVRAYAANPLTTARLRIQADTHYFIDFPRGEIVVALSDGSRRSMPFSFVTRLEDMPARELQNPLGAGMLPRPRRPTGPAPRYAAVQAGLVRSFEVEVPVDPRLLEARQMPAALKTFANMMNSAFLVAKVVDDQESLGVKTCVEIGQGLLGIVDTFDSIFVAWRVGERVTPGTGNAFVRGVEEFRARGGFTLASRTAALLSAGLDMYNGYDLLTSDESDLAAALRREDGAVAVLLAVKGGLQVGSGVLGGLTLGATIVGSAVAPPLGVVVLVGGVTLVLLDGLVVIAESGQSRLAPFFDEVFQSQEREFRRPVGARGGHDPGEGAACRTKLLLATLNDRLSTRAPA